MPGDALEQFEFATATRIVFGAGRARELGRIVRGLGRRALVVTGGNPERARPLLDTLIAEGVSAETYPVSGEPTTLHVAAGVARARLKGFEVVVGVGGGSAIDTAKAIAGLLTNERDLFDYLEVVGRGQPMTRPAAPPPMAPTTAGAGAEVTRNAVLTSKEHKVKASLRSPHLLARVALVDPELTRGLPPDVTAATGLDALTQLIEAYVSGRANPLTDALCVEGMRRAARSLRRAYADGEDARARSDMAFAALLGGLALANAGLGAVHGLAAPVGGSFPAPHGAVCAALLPGAMAVNLKAARERLPQSPVASRYTEVARILTGRENATPEDGVAWTRETVQALRIPSLRRHGITEAHCAALVEQAMAASSMKANPVALTADETREILESGLNLG
jgi:alcohol dehydrogenase class IV